MLILTLSSVPVLNILRNLVGVESSFFGCEMMMAGLYNHIVIHHQKYFFASINLFFITASVM